MNDDVLKILVPYKKKKMILILTNVVIILFKCLFVFYKNIKKDISTTHFKHFIMILLEMSSFL